MKHLSRSTSHSNQNSRQGAVVSLHQLSCCPIDITSKHQRNYLAFSFSISLSISSLLFTAGSSEAAVASSAQVKMTQRQTRLFNLTLFHELRIFAQGGLAGAGFAVFCLFGGVRVMGLDGELLFLFVTHVVDALLRKEDG